MITIPFKFPLDNFLLKAVLLTFIIEDIELEDTIVF